MFFVGKLSARYQQETSKKEVAAEWKKLVQQTIADMAKYEGLGTPYFEKTVAPIVS